MATVLVTGGTGRLGRQVRPLLAAQGIHAVALSRRGTPSEDVRVADLTTGEGLDRALQGVDLLVHAATAPGRAQQVDVEGTRVLLARARAAGVQHVVYTSVVGVERNPYAYYRRKLAAEQLVAASGVPYTIARGTQFFEFVAEIAARAHVGALGVAPFRWALAPCDVAEFAGFVARKMVDKPINGVVEFAGPETLDLAAMIRQWRHSRGMPGPVLQLPLPGKVGVAFRRGSALPVGPASRGAAVWRDWRQAQPGAVPIR